MPRRSSPRYQVSTERPRRRQVTLPLETGETSQGESDASRIHYTSVCGNLLLRGGNPPNFEHKNGVYKFGQPRPGDAQVVGRIDEAGRYINVSSLWFMWLIAGRNIRVYRR